MRRFRRVIAGGADQAISSLTNVLFLVSFARSASTGDYGALSVGMATLVFGIGISRNALGTLFAVRGKSLEDFSNPEARWLVSSSTFAAMLIMCLVLIVGQYTGALSRLGTVFVLFAIAGSFAPVQDVLRFAAISMRRSTVALVGDVIWFLCVAVCLALDLMGIAAFQTGAAFVIAWNLGLLVSLLFMSIELQAKPKFSGCLTWARRNRTALRRLVLDGILGTLVALIVAVATAKVLSLDDTAGLRGASTLIGPIAVIFSAIPLVVVPELSTASEQQMRRAKLWLPLILVSIVSLFGGALSFLPMRWGEALLGSSWGLAHQVVPITALEYVLLATIVYPMTAMKLREEYGGILILRMVYVTSALAGVAVGLLAIQSIRGVAWGLVFAALVHSLAAWVLSTRRERQAVAGASAAHR